MKNCFALLRRHNRASYRAARSCGGKGPAGSDGLRADDLRHGARLGTSAQTDNRPSGRRTAPSSIDKAGNIYTSANKGVVVFSPDGKVIRSFLGDKYSEIHDMKIREEDGTEFIYGARNNNAEGIKFNAQTGEIVLKLPFPEESGLNLKKFNPTAITVAPNGDIFLSDGYASNHIFKFDKTGKYLKHFGSQGNDLKQFNTAHGMTLDTRYDPPRLLICDRNHEPKGRLLHYDLDGNFIDEVVTGLGMPTSAAVQGDYVSVPDLHGRLVILDKSNTIIAVLGHNPDPAKRVNFNVPQDQWIEGIFSGTHGSYWDKDGNLYVQDWNVIGPHHEAGAGQVSGPMARVRYAPDKGTGTICSEDCANGASPRRSFHQRVTTMTQTRFGIVPPLLAVGIVVVLACRSPAAPTLDASNNAGPSSAALTLAPSNFRAQSFTVTNDGLLTQVDVQVGKFAGATSDVTFELRPIVSTLPGNDDRSIIYKTGININDIPVINSLADPPPYVSVDVTAAGIHAKPGEKYAISMRRSGSSPNAAWRAKPNNYSGGNGFFRSLLSSAWSPTTDDYGFQTWVDPTTDGPL